MHEKNPWKTRSSKFLYENPWISLREDQVTNPGGGKGIYGVVSMKNKAIGIIPLDKDGNTWLVGQYRYTLDEYSWEIPMGGGPLHENILDAAKRELKEETGLIAQSWQQIMRIHTSNSVTDEEGFVFVAKDLTEGNMDTEETEELSLKKIPFLEAYQMAMQGQITDAISLCGILKVKSMFF